MVIRNKIYLSISNVVPLVWKLIIGEPITDSDYLEIDSMFGRPFTEMMAIDSDFGFEFIYCDHRFVYNHYDDELCENGRERILTRSNREEYIRLYKEYFHCPEIVDAIKVGLGAIVPLHTLSLYTADEFETLICGKKEFNVSLLRGNTNYSGCNASDEHIQFFWQVLNELSEEDKEMFLKFVWGRSRLPLTADEFSRPFKITTLSPSSNGTTLDQLLPKSHTCFFQLDLPRYTSAEILKTKLLFAIYNCPTTELDGAGGAGLGVTNLTYDDAENDDYY